jgi:hypothetical protein
MATFGVSIFEQYFNATNNAIRRGFWSCEAKSDCVRQQAEQHSHKGFCSKVTVAELKFKY